MEGSGKQGRNVVTKIKPSNKGEGEERKRRNVLEVQTTQNKNKHNYSNNKNKKGGQNGKRFGRNAYTGTHRG